MASRELLRKLNLKNLWHLLAVGFGAGLAPKSPGTFGSLAAIPICMVLLYIDPIISALFIVLSFFIGVKACSEAEKAMGVHDHGGIVIDEFVGMFISVMCYPANYWYAFLAFVLFRIFDILKPFPVSLADKKVAGGFGIMIDDVLAGIYAFICGSVILSFI